ncbi:DNA glycosylase family protein [Streptomyces goshikiensis]|uniref:hypothetical protein n=1 Tax=Streptomyces goshikiensis TaxID=1942 RepID=UPI003652EBBA
MTELDAVQRLVGHVRVTLGGGPFSAPGGWSHMGAVICDASFQARRKYESTVRPRIERLQEAWPDAVTVRGFRDRIAAEDLAVAMDFNSPRRVATAHGIADLLAANGVDTREDLRTWLDDRSHRGDLRAVKGVGPKTVDYIGNLVGRSQVAVDVHLRAAYEAAAAVLGQEPGGLEHAVWRFTSRAARGRGGAVGGL